MSGQLFLMEFLVDNVNVPAIRAIHEEVLPATTCVSFQILDLPPLNIYQESPAEKCACSDSGQQVFKKGKSCLFALPKFITEKPLCSFPVRISVYKEFPPGVLPDVMLIGSHQLQACSLMNSLLSRRDQKTGDDSETMKNTFKIATTTGQCVGEVTVFIRASYFGEKIVTQFQSPDDDKPYLFKGVDDGPVFQCKRITSASDRRRVECVCTTKKTSDGSGEAARVCCSLATDERRRREDSKAKCPPCCIVRQDEKKQVPKKCGCVAKEDRTCTCVKRS
ncbi:PREDICTED: microtubule-associated protein 10-like [Dinoponera quadriceps]|uniref:Microtubule-associated protein 10-like n=1 Tax=Dinoponera quadriceps TaxID=609295 RepID=A0A6P3XZI6_DINQU|nr:PREDICTED: microtubule-associated protein 10-like [Dinoponera quadriceps]